MRRADRLFHLVQLIRGRRLTTAAFLAVQQQLQTLREAMQARRTVTLAYQDATGQSSQRRVRPLGCFFWGKVWTLAAWCETRNAFRTFRQDRIGPLQLHDAVFRDEAGKTLADFLRQAGAPPG